MIITELLSILEFVALAIWNVWPAFLISVGLGVLVRALKLDGVIRSVFSARIHLAILLAAAVGAFSPFCSCSVVPVISGLLLSGVPLAPVMAFWIASPTMDPEIFALSVATLGWPLATARLAATLILSLGGGYVTLLLVRAGILAGNILRHQEQPAAQPVPAVAEAPLAAGFVPVMSLASSGGPELSLSGTTCASGTCTVSAPVAVAHHGWAAVVDSLRGLDWRQFGRDMFRQSWEMGRWLVLAFVLEAVVIRYVPQEAIAGLLGGTSGWAVPLAALIGVPLYLNNVTALPIVAGLLRQGMQPGAAIAFLIAGPITTFPAMMAVWGIVRRRVFALYFGLSLFGAMVLGYLANLILA